MRRRQSDSFCEESLEKRATIELNALPVHELLCRARETVQALIEMGLVKPPAWGHAGRLSFSEGAFYHGAHAGPLARGCAAAARAPSRGLSEVQIGEGAMAALVVVTSYTDAELA